MALNSATIWNNDPESVEHVENQAKGDKKQHLTYHNKLAKSEYK